MSVFLVFKCQTPEHFIADIYRCLGYEAIVTPKSNDGGKDIILKKKKEIIIVECKRYNSPKVTRPDLQKFHSALVDTKATKGIYVTTGQYTKTAEQFVKSKPIELLDYENIVELLNQIDNEVSI